MARRILPESEELVEDAAGNALETVATCPPSVADAARRLARRPVANLPSRGAALHHWVRPHVEPPLVHVKSRLVLAGSVHCVYARLRAWGSTSLGAVGESEDGQGDDHLQTVKRAGGRTSMRENFFQCTYF